MSKFTKTAAKKCGWIFVHEQGEEVSTLAGPQQLTKTAPSSFRAEKATITRDGHHKLLNEQAESMELLLTRIAASEEFQSRLDLPEPVLRRGAISVHGVEAHPDVGEVGLYPL